MSRRRAFGARAALAVLLAAATAWAWTHRELFDLTVIEVALGGVGAWAPAGFVLLFALATVLFVPGSVFGLAGGFLFGPVFGTLWNLLGATLGATLAFLAARFVASDWVERRAGERLQQLLAGVQAEGWRFVALMRLVPLAPFNLLNYALGLTRIRIAEYVITTLVCMVPGTAAYAWLGHAGREAAAGDSAALHYGVVGLGLLAAVLMLPRLVGRLRAKPVKWISVAELRRRVDTDGDVTVVDVRDPDEFTGTSGHIPRARNIPLRDLPLRRQELIGIEPNTIVLVCRTDRRSAKAADVLRAAGLRDVLVLRNGMEAWNGNATAPASPVVSQQVENGGEDAVGSE